jgi:WD40 repeat protein
VTASDDKTARIWEARSGRELFALSHAERVATARFSPDGHGVITAAGDAAPIWNADTGEKISELAAEAIQSAVFSPDGQRALTSSHEETFVRVWDVASSRTIVTVPVLPANPGMIHISTASLSGDGQHMVAVVQDGTARIWKVYPTVQDMLDYIKRWIPRCLTGDQRKAAFLDGAPPIWCIEMEKWPYDTDAWRSWLAQKKAGLMPPLPQAP